VSQANATYELQADNALANLPGLTRLDLDHHFVKPVLLGPASAAAALTGCVCLRASADLLQVTRL